MKKARSLAYYLPQFHPVSEKDEWWGRSFTEWTNVAKAKPLFKGHYQPRLPADLGFYDLRRWKSAKRRLKWRRHTALKVFVIIITGFTALECSTVFLLKFSNRASRIFRFVCAGQMKPGEASGLVPMRRKFSSSRHIPENKIYEKHFDYLRRVFEDKRHITIDGKPLFHVYAPTQIPDLKLFTDTFRELAHRAGYKGIYLLGGRSPLDWNPKDHDFDGVVGSEIAAMRYYTTHYYENLSFFEKLKRRVRDGVGLRMVSDVEKRKKPIVIDYKIAIEYLITEKKFEFDYFPCLVPNWDNTPRAGKKGLVFKNSMPELWKKHLLEGVKKVEHLAAEHQIVMIKSWNEWAEGNYLEPDTVFGMKYLEVVKEVIME